MAKITGNSSSERLSGTRNSDTIYGGGGNDQLLGLQGNDILEGGAGNDVLEGGAGDDLVRGFSWGGEPVAAQDGTLINAGEPIADNDMLSGGPGSDTFEIRWLIDAKPEILEKHRNPDSGFVDYNAGTGGVAGENDNSHDHWVETQGIGTKTIVDYNENEDTLLFHGHTVNLKSLSHQNGDTILKFYSNQNGNGAHDGDDVGTVIIKGVRLDEGDIDVDAGVFFGTETALIRPTSGTGLDRLVDIILSDPNLSAGAPSDEIVEGALAADALNHIIIDAIKGTGVANDGSLNGIDVRQLNAYIQQNRYNEWVELHGDDSGNSETGFHLVQGDGGSTRLFGKIAVTTVAEEIYNLGFDIEGKFLTNEDGARSQSVNVVATYLNKLLADDLASGELANQNVNAAIVPDTNTGLDRLVTIINEDASLRAKIPHTEINAGAAAANKMNDILIKAIVDTGVAKDGALTGSDMRQINTYIRAKHLGEWARLHGDDEGNGTETGFHLVQGDGAKAKLFGKDAVDSVMDEIYHLGFRINGRFLENEDGAQNQSINVVAGYLNKLLAGDLASGALSGSSVNPPVVNAPAPTPTPTPPPQNNGPSGPNTGDGTGTGLDAWVDIIRNDPAWPSRIGYGLLSRQDVEAGAEAANGMNQIIVDSIRATGVVNDGSLNGTDIRAMNEYIRANRLGEWTRLHGDDEGNVETGFHRVQGDGGGAKLYGKAAIDSVMDETYHLGFKIVGKTFYNEDGNANQSINVVAGYLNKALAADLANGTLSNASALPDVGALTGTGLDDLIDIILSDRGLNARTPIDEIYEGAAAANQLNHLIIEAIERTGAGSDRRFDGDDMRKLNAYIRQNDYDDFITYHGDDEGGVETGFHLVQGDGGTSNLFGKKAINTVMDELYHIGFKINGRFFENEDGDQNQSINVVAGYLNRLLDDELAAGEFDAVVA